MQRRNFLQQTFGAGIATVLSSSLIAQAATATKKTAAAKPFNLNYALHDGMFQNSAGPGCLTQIRFGHAAGFRCIEDNGMMARTYEQQLQIGDLLKSWGMQMGVFVITSDRLHWKTALTRGKREWIDKLL